MVELQFTSRSDLHNPFLILYRFLYRSHSVSVKWVSDGFQFQKWVFLTHVTNDMMTDKFNFFLYIDHAGK